MDEDKKRLLAIASIIVGFIALAGGVCLAICGAFLAVVGIVLGVLAIKSDSKLIAIIGIVLNCLALVVVTLSMGYSYLLMTGQVAPPNLPFPQPSAPAEIQDAAAPGTGPSAPAPTETAPPLAPWPDEEPPD